MFVGQIAVVVFFVLRGGGAGDLGEAIRVVASSGLAISLSVIAGLPAVAAGAMACDPLDGASFADYLALRWTSWSNFCDRRDRPRCPGRGLGPAVARHRSRGDAGFHGRCAEIGAGRGRAVAAGARLLRRGSDHGRVFRARLSLSRLVGVGLARARRDRRCRRWSGPRLHLQYDWFFFGEVFCIGLWFGYIRYRGNSTWLTIVLHGLNNLGAVVQTMLLAGHA